MDGREPELLRQVAEHAADIVLVLRRGVIEWVTPSANDVGLLGYRRDELIGRRIDELVDPEHRGVLADARQRGLDGSLQVFRIPARCADGSLRWLEARARPLVDEAGVPTGAVVCTVLDVSAEVQRFAGAVAHGVNNILAVVLSNAEIALASIEQPAVVQRSLEAIAAAVARGAALTSELVDRAASDGVPAVLTPGRADLALG